MELNCDLKCPGQGVYILSEMERGASDHFLSKNSDMINVKFVKLRSAVVGRID